MTWQCKSGARNENLSCSGHWILPVVAWPMLRRVENEEISYWQMGSYVSCPCFQRRIGGGYSATRITICVQLTREGTWWPRSSRKCRMGYSPWLLSCWLLRLNAWAWGEHLTSQLSWVVAWLLVKPICPIYLVKERCYFGWVYLLLRGRRAGKCRKVVSWEGGKGVWGEWGGKMEMMCEWIEVERWERCMSGVRCQGGKGGRIVRWHGRRGRNVIRWQFRKGGRQVTRESWMEFTDKIVSYCSREAKCKQGFTTVI